MNRWMASGIALSLLLTGCGKKESAYRPLTQELRFNLHSEPPTADPRKATDTVSLSVISLCFEGLTRLNAQGKPMLALAEKVEISPDHKTYTFTLKEASWADGMPVKAGDFETTWKTVLSPTFPSEFAYDLYIIKNARAAKTQRCSLDEVGVKALDDKTLEVNLEHPVPYFLAALASHSFLASQAEVTEGHYVGNGPFMIQDWTHHSLITLAKNPHYWDKEHVKLDKIHFTIVEDETTELTMFENGELDWAGYPYSNLPTEALPTLAKQGVLNTQDIAGTYYYVFNTKAFPFTSVNLRKAFTLAINRQMIVTNVTQMGQIPATRFIPPTMWENDPAEFQDHDLKEARRLFALGLQELGITAADLSELTLSYNTLAGHHKIAQAIQEQWREAFGINVKLENKEWKVFLDELRHHKFQIARMGGLASINDPSTFLDFYRYLSSSNNFSGWSNPHFSDLLEQADQTVDMGQRTVLLKQAEEVLMQEMPIAPIYFYTGAYLKKPYVKGVCLSSLNELDLKEAYVEVNDPLPR